MEHDAPRFPAHCFTDAQGQALAAQAYLTTLAGVAAAAVSYPGTFFTSARLDPVGAPVGDRWRSMAVFLSDTAWHTMADGDVAQGTVDGLTYAGQPAGDWTASLARGDRFMLPDARPFHGDFLGVRAALSDSIDGLADAVVLSRHVKAAPAPTASDQQEACKQAIQFLCSTVAASYPTPADVTLHTAFSFSLVATMAGAPHAVHVAGRCTRVA